MIKEPILIYQFYNMRFHNFYYFISYIVYNIFGNFSFLIFLVNKDDELNREQRAFGLMLCFQAQTRDKK